MSIDTFVVTDELKKKKPTTQAQLNLPCVVNTSCWFQYVTHTQKPCVIFK